LAEAMPATDSLEMFRRMCLTRHFDLRVQQASKDKDIDLFVYLAVGQEATPAAVSMSMRGSWVLGQHRCHSIYLSFDGAEKPLVDELLGMESGCCGGLGGSPTIHDMSKRIIGHNGLVGDQVPVAAGVALTSDGDNVVCFFGDGAAEEDYVLAAFGFAASRDLPLLFVCEDNDLSVLTPTIDRRTWSVVDVAKGFGLESVDITDDPWLIDHWTREFAGRPALINVRTCRELWHVGDGSDNNAEWCRFELTKNKLVDLGLAEQAVEIEQQTINQVEELWRERLQKRSAT
ncbi:MAG: thiamine pyrophosphate-dependent enzyme, partial [Alphaproteobacteria bacterium]